MFKHLIIANPAAGGNSARQAIPKAVQYLQNVKLEFELIQTERKWHAAELAEKAAMDGYEVIVAAGGDGTVNEVINGLLAAHQKGHSAILGVLSIGRGNDFAGGLGIPANLEKACQLLVSGQPRRIDIGRVAGCMHPEGRYFGNCVGVGFDAVTTIEVAKLPRLGGFFSFLIAVLKTIFLYYRGPVLEIHYDGHSLVQGSLMVSVMNGNRLGGGFIMAPEAQLDDGLFDLCIARQVSRSRILALIPHFLRGTQATQNEIQTGRGATIHIKAVQGTLPAHTDGEIICVDGYSLEIELQPGLLEVIAPVVKFSG